MKWIGQHIYDLVSRFRDDVYLEDLSLTTETNVLVINSDGKVSYSRTLADDIIEAEIDTLSNLTSFGSAGATTNIVAGDVTMYNAVNDGNPTINIGSSATERLEIEALYASGTQQLAHAVFRTYTTSSTGNRGRFAFYVDELGIMQLWDAGIYLYDNMGIQIGGTDILTDSSGTATLNNIDALDLTTANTIHDALFDGGIVLDPGDRTVTPALNGLTLHVDTNTYTDNTTAEGATSTDFATVSIEGSTLAATQASTTANAATLYIKDAVTAGTNKTITNPYALWVDAGNTRLDGALTVSGTITGDVTGALTGQAATVATIAGLAPNTATTQATQAAITTCANLATVGTITTGIWRGTAIDQTYLTGQSGTNTGDETLSSINALDITEVGTIDSGVWEGTAVATDQQKHLAYFPIQGYGTSDGTNYEMAEIISDTNAPFEHNSSTGSDGLTAQVPRDLLKSGGMVMPRAGVLKNWTGWATMAGTSGTATIGLFKATLARNSTTTVTPVLLKTTAFTPLGNTKAEDFAETSFSVAFAAGDIIYSAVHGSVSKAWWLNSMLEVEWS
jgi:hypothetical protein